MRKHAKSLRELLKFNIELKGDIEEIFSKGLDNLGPVVEWAEKQAQEAFLGKLDVYRKAKRMGEKFARKITND